MKAGSQPETRPKTAAEAAQSYYDNYNTKRIDKIMELMAEDCVYEEYYMHADLVYQDAFVGRAAIAKYFKKVGRLVPSDIKFVVEDITEGGRKAGVRWHVELEGHEFPFSRGVSFYEVNERGQIIYARDLVEPTFKPGDSALLGIGLVAPLVRKLGPKASPSYLKQLPIAAGAMWAFYAAYIGYVMLSTWAPGPPAWGTTPEQLQSLLHESFNFFYVNVGLSQLGLNPVPSIPEHPVDEALFNFVNAWSLMFWPVMLADPRGQRVKNRVGYWVGTLFLTSVVLIPYMAARLAPAKSTDASEGRSEQQEKPSNAGSNGSNSSNSSAAGVPGYAPLFGGIGAVVGLLSLGWALAARPEYGGLAERWHFFEVMFSSNRVFWAFCLDTVLYTLWQAVLLGAAGAPAKYRYVPFVGMAAWLLQGGPTEEAEVA
ncbi:hypothetical protein N2152v2_008618 [Parachlorella kessleri]